MLLNERGQIFTLDLVLASIIFLVLLLLYVSITTDFSNRVNRTEVDEELSLVAKNATNSLVSTQGNPNYWEQIQIVDVNSIGLVSSAGEISQRKFQKLSDLNSTNYKETKKIMGLAKYGVYVSLTDFNSNLLYDFGLKPSPKDLVGVFERITLHGTSFATLRLEVYK